MVYILLLGLDLEFAVHSRVDFVNALEHLDTPSRTAWR